MTSQSTLDLAALLAKRHRPDTPRGVVFADGAELALIASLALADVAEATTLAMSDIRATRCRCGHRDGAHFDEVGVCGACPCEHFRPPGVRLRDVLIPEGRS